jgi:hypothetical protein
MTPNNNDLQMMGGMLSGPAFLPDSAVRECLTFRDAVRLAWNHRRIKAMTMATLAERCGLYASHVTDYLNAQAEDKNGRARRSMPADRIATFEMHVGNRAVTQFLVRQASLTLMEEVLEARRTA